MNLGNTNTENEYTAYSKEEITIQALQLLTYGGFLKLANSQISHGNNMCHCPFHKDNSPSMSINTSIGFNCFSCGESGSIYKLYRALTGSSLSKDLGLSTGSNDNFTRFSIPQYIPEPPDYEKSPLNGELHISGTLHDVMKHPKSIAYLRKRCIPFDIAVALEFKYAEHCFILSETNDGEKYLTEYTDRLIVPVYEQGKLISVEGRDVTGESNKKVLFPKKSSVNTLFDIDNLDYNKTLYVVEGLMDLAVLRSDPFFSNSTCIFSNIPSKRQLYWLNKFKDIVVIPDNDGRPGEKTVEVMENNLFGSFKVLPVPATRYRDENGELKKIKDVGDIPTKLQLSVEEIRRKHWLESAFRVRSKAFDMIQY